jgi:hypothetical protein
MRPTRIICVAATAVALWALAATSSAFASGLTLGLTPPADLVVGTPAILTATGTIPLEDSQYPYWFSLDAIPVSVTTTCPADRYEANQIADSTGGAVLVLSQREQPDANGGFSIRVGITPTAAGSVLLCGYTDDGETNTLAAASTVLQIRDARSPSTDPGPAAASIPAQARAAVRSCNALLGPPGNRRCVRHAIALASKQCRQLRPRAKRAACLRGVRRARSAR